MHVLDYFFQPRAVAVVGASNNKFSWGNWVSENLLAYRKRGNVYLVNPKGNKVLGLQTFPNISAIPEQIDFVVVIVPAPRVPTILEECITNGIKVVTLITAGFAEAEEGHLLQEELVKIAQRGKIRIQGPNCNGFFHVKNGINVSSQPNKFLIDSPVTFITQSGYIGQALSYWGAPRNLTFGKYISVGNEVDLTITDYVEYFGDDPTTKVIVLYIEGVRDGNRFRNVIKKVIQKKPIIVWKTGESPAVARAAHSHTGKLVGSQQVFEGIKQQTGLFEITAVEYILPLSHALYKHPPLMGKRIGIITFGAGFGVVLTDTIIRAGFEVPEFSADIKQKFRKIIPQYRASVKNPIDIGAAGDYQPDTLFKPVNILFRENEVDGIVMANLGEGEMVLEVARELEVYIAKKLQQLEKKLQKPIFLFTILTEFESPTVQEIVQGGPVYHNAAELVAVLEGLYHFRHLKHQPLNNTKTG